MARALVIALVTVALSACEARQPQNDADNALSIGHGFDFYVLAMSWSPGYCAAEGDRANPQQCGADAEFAFIVHGLWPQFERGWPEFCETGAPLSVSRDQAEQMAEIMPSAGLMRHQWTKHGSCTGLSQPDYFAVTRAAFERIAVPKAFERRDEATSLSPDEIETAFQDANPDLPGDAIAVTCRQRLLRDVRICLSRDLTDFVACPEVDRRACPLSTVIVPPNV